MRTNVVIDDTLMEKAMLLTGIKTKREVVDEALRLLIRTSEQKSILALRGKIKWESDLNEMRTGRYMHESRPEHLTGEVAACEVAARENSINTPGV